jgi:hypothetical protein
MVGLLVFFPSFDSFSPGRDPGAPPAPDAKQIEPPFEEQEDEDEEGGAETESGGL